MTNEMIKKLEDAGFRRWTKGNYDRLYASNEAKRLDIEYYKTGSIENATLDGEGISNNGARNCKDEKVYIDIATGKLETKGYNNYHDELMTAVEHTLNEAGFELTEDGEVIEKKEEEDMTDLRECAGEALEMAKEDYNLEYTEQDIEDMAKWFKKAWTKKTEITSKLFKKFEPKEPERRTIVDSIYDEFVADRYWAPLREEDKKKYGHTVSDLSYVDYDRDMDQYTFVMYGGDMYDIMARDLSEEDAHGAKTDELYLDAEDNFSRFMAVATKREEEEDA